jgi:hypothetical protein
MLPRYRLFHTGTELPTELGDAMLLPYAAEIKLPTVK